tara:strand:+ start:192 stop:728 length:537 start_codon:yes stop_codon:yes gene_type:complete
MKLISVVHKADILVDTYLFHDSLKKEVIRLLSEGAPCIPQNDSNVKATMHTVWDWEPNNIKFRNVKAYIREEIERHYKPGAFSDGGRTWLKSTNFWANLYEKGDYAQPHDHKPSDFSFAYFLKSEDDHAAFVFTDSGYKIIPKEGTFVAFPAYLNHHVEEHKVDDKRITLSGNFQINK